MVRDLVRAASSAVAPQNGTFVWRTTTAGVKSQARRSAHDRTLHAVLRQLDVAVLDAWRITQPLAAFRPQPFFDDNHPWPEVYAELNNALLNMVCLV